MPNDDLRRVLDALVEALRHAETVKFDGLHQHQQATERVMHAARRVAAVWEHTSQARLPRSPGGEA